MTVCIAALCDNSSGVVLIADRMITSGLAIQFEHPLARKVTALSGNCVAMTAGDALAYTELFDEVRRKTANRCFTAVEDFVEIVKQSYQNLRQKQIVERVLRPLSFESFDEFYRLIGRLPEAMVYDVWSKIHGHDYGLEILLGGMTYDQAHIYAVADPGTSHCFDSIGFHVIGSGMNLAMSSLISSTCHAEMSRDQVLVRAFDAKQTAENAPGVGRLTDVSVILEDGSVHFTNEQIKRLKHCCRAWKNGDKTCLDEVNAMIDATIPAGESGVSPVPESSIIPAEDKYESNSKTKADATTEGVSDRDAASNEASPDDSPREG